jgi:hypothetical protein
MNAFFDFAFMDDISFLSRHYVSLAGTSSLCFCCAAVPWEFVFYWAQQVRDAVHRHLLWRHAVTCLCLDEMLVPASSLDI